MAFKKGTNRIDNFNASTALMQGGIVSQGSGTTTINVTAGEGTVSFPTGEFADVCWSEFINEPVTTIGSAGFTAIGIDINGDLFFKAGGFTDSDERDFIQLGIAVHLDQTNITNVSSGPIVGTNIANSLNDFGQVFGSVNQSGNLISGADTADLKIQKSAGETFGLGIGWDINQKELNVIQREINTGATFNYSHRDGVGGYVTVTATTQDIDPGFYDDGSGTLATVATNRFTVQRVYWFAKADQYVVTYGQALYTTLQNAIDAATSEKADINPLLTSVAERSFISIKGNVVDLTNTGEAEFTEGPAFKGSAVQGGSGGGGASLPTTTKGDLIIHNGSTNVRLPIGSNNQHLISDSTQAEGARWADTTFVGNPIDGSINTVSGSNTSTGSYSFAVGKDNIASGNFSSVAGGQSNTASGKYSSAEGYGTVAAGNYGHAEGLYSEATEGGSHAEGARTTASGAQSHAEGSNTQATGGQSHSQGIFTFATGNRSHAGGGYSTASGMTSFLHADLSTVESDNSSILGGVSNRLTAAATGSTILGGTGITGTSIDTVYVPNIDASGIIFSGGTNLEDIFEPIGGGATGNTEIISIDFEKTGLVNVAQQMDEFSSNVLISGFTKIEYIGCEAMAESGSATAAGDAKIAFYRRAGNQGSARTLGTGTLISDDIVISATASEGALFDRKLEVVKTSPVDISSAEGEFIFCDLSAIGNWSFNTIRIKGFFRLTQ